MPSHPKIVLLLTLFCWLSPAQAFFCFSFGGHGHGSNRHGFRQHYFQAPPPPPLFAPRIAEHTQPEPDLELPAIAPSREKPVIIQGYRFRPLGQGRQSEVQAPALYQQK